MLRINGKLMMVLLLINGTTAISAERTKEPVKEPIASSNSLPTPSVTPTFDLQTAAPILNITELYDFRDYPMPSCGSNTPLCGPLGQSTPTRLFIAVPANSTIVSSYIQTWVGGYWSLSLNKEFTLLNIGMDW